MVVDSGAAEIVMPRSMFPEIGIRQTERSKKEERTSRIMDSIAKRAARFIDQLGHNTVHAQV